MFLTDSENFGKTIGELNVKRYRELDQSNQEIYLAVGLY